MRTTQRIIKYFAIALAVLIIATIFSAIVGGLMIAGAVVFGDDFGWNQNAAWVVDGELETAGIRDLDINVKATTLKIKVANEGEKARVETNNEYVMTGVSNGTLSVVEKSYGIFGWGGKGEVVIYVRKGAKFGNVKIEVGAGVLEIEELEAKELEMNLGAGKTSIEKVRATEKMKIDGGAGLMEIKSGEISNASMSLGAGKAEIRAKLSGDNKIDSGVGKVELSLEGNEEDYKISVDKGIGSVSLNGQSLGDGEVRGDGKTRLEIESGVGAVEIRTER